MVGCSLIYLSNPPASGRGVLYKKHGIGIMVTPMIGNSPSPGYVWGADTGCFANPNGFNLDEYLTTLDQWRQVLGPPLFATAPDVLGDPQTTWERSQPVLPVLREHGYVAALVAQNGIENLDIEWSAFDCLFIGGTIQCPLCGYIRPGDDEYKTCIHCDVKLIEWKEAPATLRLIGKAKRLGKLTHMGRVNSFRRFKIATEAGCAVSDGTYIGFGPDVNIPKVVKWLEWAREWEARPFEGWYPGKKK